MRTGRIDSSSGAPLTMPAATTSPSGRTSVAAAVSSVRRSASATSAMVEDDWAAGSGVVPTRGASPPALRTERERRAPNASVRAGVASAVRASIVGCARIVDALLERCCALSARRALEWRLGTVNVDELAYAAAVSLTGRQ